MWEYTSINAGDLESLIKQANILGEQGWEAFSFTSTKQGYGWGKHIMVLKRRK
jgi:hypothetical protein